MKEKQKSVDEAWVLECAPDGEFRPRVICEEKLGLKDLACLYEKLKPRHRIRKWRAEKVCEWRRNDIDGYYETECGDAFIFNDGTPRMNNAKFCPYCGGKIKVNK